MIAIIALLAVALILGYFFFKAPAQAAQKEKVDEPENKVSE